MQLFQIAYDESSLSVAASSGFQVLNNLANERPDWYEYWPIRNFLLQNFQMHDDWYGFFSPKFGLKTNMGFKEVEMVVREADLMQSADVVLFSPQPDMGANFLNVFEQAELFDAGFIETAQQFFRLMGLEVPLANIVMDSRQTVFSNYFVAKSKFWNEWFAWSEMLFSCAEDNSHPLQKALCHPTSYSSNAQRKVFLLERIASLLLVLKPEYKTYVANPFTMGWSMARFRNAPLDTVVNDALKRAYRDTGFPEYIDAYKAMRERFKRQSER